MVRRGIGALTLLTLCTFAPMSAGPDEDLIDVWFLGRPAGVPVRAGARMAAAEMTQTSTLLGRTFALHEVEVSSLEEAKAALSRATRTDRTTFVVVDLEWAMACELAGGARRERVVWLATRIPDRGCEATLLQVRLPQPARENTLAGHVQGRTAGQLRVDEWHPSLTRFGAGELNERFERYASQHADALLTRGDGDPPVMDGDVWAGWFAVKVATESALRGIQTQERLTQPDGPRYDGHKGVALHFGPSGVLQQPVFIIDYGAAPDRRAVVAEIP